MSKTGIQGIIRKAVLAIISDKATPCPLDHRTVIPSTGFNRLWLSDFTYVATVYVAFVFYAYARRIVG